MTVTTTQDVGALLREWRQRRNRSQLDVSIAADVSTRHLSWLETGRATPSRPMIARLCDELDVPLRERNGFYLAAGFAPAHEERPLRELGPAQEAVEALLAGHDPYPSVAVNVRWDVLASNAAMQGFLGDLPEELRGPPLNTLRMTLHPAGMLGQLVDPGRWRANALRRVRRQWERTQDQGVLDLLRELESYPLPDGAVEAPPHASDDIALPLRMRTEAGELALLYALTVFGAPRDVTLDEIAIETFFPADEATRRLLTGA